MILAIDVYYTPEYAKAVALVFAWESETEQDTLVCSIPIAEVREYIPGEFYKRELPCIMEVLKLVDLEGIEVIIVDGHVYVDNEQKPGLGGHLYRALHEEIPIIGVAKRSFLGNGDTVIEVFRGESKNPLFVSAIGMKKEKAADFIQKMHGEFRFPTILRKLDGVTKA